MGPPQLCCCPELCLQLETTPEPHIVTGPARPLLHLETPLPAPPPPAPPPPSLPPAPSRLWIHPLHPKPTSNFLTLVGNSQQRGGGFPEARFPSRVPPTVPGLGWDLAFWAHSSPHSEGRLCVLPGGLRSAQTRFGARGLEGAPQEERPPEGAAAQGSSSPRPPGEDPGEPSVCRAGVRLPPPSKERSRWGRPAAGLVSMSGLLWFGGAGRSDWGHRTWAGGGWGAEVAGRLGQS